MGWFDRLLGREKVRAPDGEELKGFAKRGWESTSEERRAQTTIQYLETVAGALGLSQPIVVPMPEKYRADLRGSASGFPLTITIDYSGSVDEIVFRYANTKLEAIDLEYDPELPEAPPDERRILLAPQIFVEGDEAKQEAARFRELPRELQTRVIAEIRRLRIRYFRSRREEFAITMQDDANEVAEPVQWLVDVVSLALEVAGARGAVPAGSTASKPKTRSKPDAENDAIVHVNPRKLGTELASKIARTVTGAKLVKRPNDEKLDVRWSEGDIAVRVVLDLEYETLEVEARAEDIGDSFDLYWNPDVSVERHPETGDPWDEVDRHIFFAKAIYVHGVDSAARREAALLQALPDHVLDDLVRAMEELALDAVSLDDQTITTTICDLDAVPPDADARALRIARLLAKVAKALPRGQIRAGTEPVRCATCHALWFPGLVQTCTHCGASR